MKPDANATRIIALCFFIFLNGNLNANCFKSIKNSHTLLLTLRHVVFINNKFIVSDSNGYVLTSNTGNKWSINTVDGYSFLDPVSWDGEKYFTASGLDSSYISNDLIYWEPAYALIEGDKKFSRHNVYHVNDNYFIMYNSKIGVDLNMVYWGVPYNMRGVFSFDENVTQNYKRFLYGSNISSLVKGGQVLPPSRDIIFFDKNYYLLTRSKGVFVSQNMANWDFLGGEKQPHGFAQSLAHNDSVLVAVGDFGYISTSGDKGKTWKVIKLDTEADLYDVIWDKKQFIAVGNCGTIAKSINGYEWSFASTGLPDFYTSIAYNGKVYVVVGAGPGELKSAKSSAKLRQRMFISGDAENWVDLTKNIIDLYIKE